MRGLLTEDSVIAVTVISSAPSFPAIRPRKSLGQHFLVDNRILARIVAASQVTAGDTVVEIGPGRGVLTRRLLTHAARVVAVEMDDNLAKSLPARLDHPASLSVVNADARTVDLDELVGESPYKVVANLPYYAANPIIRRFLEANHPPTEMVLMVQREVAESIAAAPGKMSLLSVAVQFYAGARMVCSVPPSAFRPAPKVTSAVVRLELLPKPALDETEAQAFFNLVRAGFSAPRKQLHNSLGHGLGLASSVSHRILEDTGIDGSRRAGTLSLEEWLKVYRVWACVDVS